MMPGFLKKRGIARKPAKASSAKARSARNKSGKRAAPAKSTAARRGGGKAKQQQPVWRFYFVLVGLAGLMSLLVGRVLM
ncbi:MAG: hypothetical protein ACPG1A_14845, partial [Halioglobus sp.]